MPNAFKPYWHSPGRKVTHVTVARDLDDNRQDYKLLKHVAIELCKQGKLGWSFENKCYYQLNVDH